MPDRSVIVSIEAVSVVYPGRNPVLSEVSFELPSGSAIGLAGESGCGKSTLARCIAGWQAPTSGFIRRQTPVQLVMQDPGAGLNPRFRAGAAVEEPLRLAGWANDPEATAAQLLERACIPAKEWRKRTGEFSGGERARIAIARAVAATPEYGGLLILDESLSALDEATRRLVLTWLRELREQRSMSMFFISHDPEVLAHETSRVLRLENGQCTG